MAPSEDPLELLRDTDLRVTAQRLGILEALVAVEGHPTAEEVWEQAREDQPTLSLSTVYDTLSRFADRGLVDEVHAGDEPTRYEFFNDAHVNLVCEACGAVEDADASHLEDLIHEVDGGSGFQVPTQPVKLAGVCSECANDG